MINKIRGVLFHSLQQFCSTLINKTFPQKDTYFNIFSPCHPGWVPWLSATSQSVDNFMGPLLCCMWMSQLSIFKVVLFFFLANTHFSHKKLWLTVWGLSWSSLRATVVSIAVRIPVRYLQSWHSCFQVQGLPLQNFLFADFVCWLSVMKLKESFQF